MEDFTAIGKNIKSYRESFGLSQQEIANLIGVSRGTITYYETGSRMPSMQNIEKLADFFGIEPIDLINENIVDLEVNSVIAFKKKNLKISDLKSIARFRRIVKNYIKLNESFAS